MTPREEYIRGLRQLADFLAVNPGIPTPVFPGEIIVHAPYEADDLDAFAFVDRVALAMGVEPVESDGHYWAVLRFGPVGFEALAITRERKERHRAVSRVGEAALASVHEPKPLPELPLDGPRRVRGAVSVG